MIASLQRPCAYFWAASDSLYWSRKNSAAKSLARNNCSRSKRAASSSGVGSFSSHLMPYILPKCWQASTKVSVRRSMMKLIGPQVLPHPKQCAMPLALDTLKEGVFSPWKGQQHSYKEPARFSSRPSSWSTRTMSRSFSWSIASCGIIIPMLWSGPPRTPPPRLCL